jgi:predicted lipoprotein with Yx(FWY)xxD motif
VRRVALLLLVAGLLVSFGCGGSDTDNSEDAAPPGETAEASGQRDDAAKTEKDQSKPSSGSGSGTTITADDSEFGRMLFGSDGQAIYIFENDSEDETVCYGDCAEEWPPVFTNGEPTAAAGVEESLLGTVERSDGRQQVTYDGQPLYFYAHEEPGEVRCHNVNLNGGFWWAVGPDGERLL